MTIARFTVVLASMLALACGGPPASDHDGGAGSDAGHADAGTQMPDGGADLTPGELDRSYGTGGFVDSPVSLIDRLVAREGGGAMAIQGATAWVLDGAGAEVAHLGPVPNARSIVDIAPLEGGGWLALVELTFDDYPHLIRLDEQLAFDDTFGAATDALADFGALAALARDPSSGAIFVAGTQDDGVTTHVAVRALGADGSLDASFGEGGIALATLEGIEVRGPARLLSDGSIAVSCTQRFTPCVARFTAAGVPDASFGTGGVAVLDAFGPRYPRALEVDSSGRLWLLGMSNDTIQLARLSADGMLDDAFGQAGIASLSAATLSTSDHVESVEVRALALQSDGRAVVVGTFEIDDPYDGTPDDDDLLVGRFTAAGQLDASFGEGGWTRLDVDPSLVRTQTWTPDALIDGDRLLVAGQHLRDTTWRSFVAAIGL